MTQVQNLIIVRKFDKGFARIVTSMDWCGSSKDIKFICNIFICDLIVEFIRLLKKNLV
jgi:hypothetical protein